MKQQAITGVEFSRKAATQGATSCHIDTWRLVGFEPATFRTEGTTLQD